MKLPPTRYVPAGRVTEVKIFVVPLPEVATLEPVVGVTRLKGGEAPSQLGSNDILLGVMF